MYWVRTPPLAPSEMEDRLFQPSGSNCTTTLSASSRCIPCEAVQAEDLLNVSEKQEVDTATAGTVLLNRSKEVALLIYQGRENAVESMVLIVDRSEYAACFNVASIEFFTSTVSGS